MSGFGNIVRAYEELAANCEPYQYLRELVHNSLYHGRATDVWVKEDSAFPGKLSVIDNGQGIENLRESTRLFVDSPTQTFDNKGLGGKIASAARSNAIVYRTMHAGHYDSLTLRFKPFQIDPGPDVTLWPSQLRHGTIVTLLGKNNGDNTLESLRREGQDSSGRWAVHYINRKFWTLPAGVRVTVFDMKPTRDTRPCEGMKSRLDEACSGKDDTLFGGAHGQVQATPDYSVIWYLLPDRKSREHANLTIHLGITSAVSRDESSCLSGGGLGFLFENEVYGLRFGKEAGLRDFGIRCGASRVLLFIQATRAKLESDTARSNLFTRDADGDKQPIPLRDIAAQFAKRVPVPIQRLMELHEGDSLRGRSRYVNDKMYRLYQPLLDPLKKGTHRAGALVGEDLIGLPQMGLPGSPESVGDGEGGPVPLVNDRKDVIREVLRLGNGRKRRMGLSEAPPMISVRNTPLDGEFEAENKYAATFTVDYDAKRGYFDHCVLSINWSWPGWEAHLRGFERISRIVDKGEIIRRTVPMLISACLSGMEAVKVDGQPLAYLHEVASTVGLTAVASARNALIFGKDEYPANAEVASAA